MWKPKKNKITGRSGATYCCSSTMQYAKENYHIRAVFLIRYFSILCLLTNNISNASSYLPMRKTEKKLVIFICQCWRWRCHCALISYFFCSLRLLSFLPLHFYFNELSFLSFLWCGSLVLWPFFFSFRVALFAAEYLFAFVMLCKLELTCKHIHIQISSSSLFSQFFIRFFFFFFHIHVLLVTRICRLHWSAYCNFRQYDLYDMIQW